LEHFIEAKDEPITEKNILAGRRTILWLPILSGNNDEVLARLS